MPGSVVRHVPLPRGQSHPLLGRSNPVRTRFGILVLLIALFTAMPGTAYGQRTSDGDRALNIGVNKVGLSIGDSREWTGIRLNWRDSRLRRARGINATIWRPYDGGHGDIHGLALGLPLTGGRNVRGLQFGGGIEAEEELLGIGLGALGMGAGEKVGGIMVGGLGIGTGGDLAGIIVGGLGAGGGGDARGLVVGGAGAGVGGDVRGIVVGGLGAGAGGELRGLGIGGLGIGAGGGVTGIAVGGLGVGSGGEVSGLMVGGLGVAAGGGGRGVMIGGLGAGVGGDFSGIGVGGLGIGGGGDMTGIFLGGAGVGSGGTLKYLSIAGLGVGAPTVKGVAIGGLGVGGHELEGVMIGGATVRVVEGGTLRGVGVSPVNYIQGTQRALTIGIVNYAWELHGLQLGVIDIVRRNPAGGRVLPLVNWGS